MAGRGMGGEFICFQFFSRVFLLFLLFFACLFVLSGLLFLLLFLVLFLCYFGCLLQVCYTDKYQCRRKAHNTSPPPPHHHPTSYTRYTPPSPLLPSPPPPPGVVLRTRRLRFSTLCLHASPATRNSTVRFTQLHCFPILFHLKWRAS